MKIFLSYAPADRPWTNELASLLISAGLAVSSRETEIRLGEDWEDHFRRVFNASDLMVFIFTEHSAGNPNVLFELGVALGSKKPTRALWVASETSEVPAILKGRRLVRVQTPQEAAKQINAFISEQMAVA